VSQIAYPAPLQPALAPDNQSCRNLSLAGRKSVIRTPLRPLARILSARAKGENPDAIERENLRLRHEVMRDSARQKAEGRLLLLGAAFVLCFGAVGARMGVLAAAEPVEPQTADFGHLYHHAARRYR
jgi:cell division protein FtsI (penicillin-binding protein 3)